MAQKIVINACFGGFSLSKKAVARIAELQNRECYFFTYDIKREWYTPTTIENKDFMWSAFDVADPNTVLRSDKDWHDMTMEERRAQNEKYSLHDFSDRDVARDDPFLVQVVEELGDEANGAHASLKVVEIPDGIEWVIEEYDGNETIAEVHRTWS